MSTTFIARLQEQRANIWEGMKASLDAAAAEKRDLSAEEQAEFDRRNADLDGLDARIKQIVEAQERTADLDASLARVGAGPVDPRAARQGEAETVRAWLRGEGGRSLTIQAGAEHRDMLVSAATAGGNTVPTSFRDQLWEHLITSSAILSAGATVLTTSGGEPLQLPTTTVHPTAVLTAEGAALTESDPTTAVRTLGAYKYGSLHQISSELLADTAVDILGYLARAAGRAAGNAFGAHLATGTGSSQPTGIMTSTTLGVTSATGTVGQPTADNLIDLYYSVIEGYRNSPACAWLMRDATVASIRKLKDTTNQYLWQPGLAGVPDTILGKPIRTDPGIAATALNARSIAFGDMSAYHVRVAGGWRFERSDEFAFNADLVTFRSVMRGDGILLDQTGAVKHLVGAAS